MVSPGQLNATSTSMISHSCEPSTKTMKMSSGSSGMLLTMSARALDDQVGRATLVATQQAEPGADGGAHDRSRDTDDERDGQSEQQPFGQVTALGVGAHQAKDAAADHDAHRADLSVGSATAIRASTR